VESLAKTLNPTSLILAAKDANSWACGKDSDHFLKTTQNLANLVVPKPAAGGSMALSLFLLGGNALRDLKVAGRQNSGSRKVST